MSATDTRSQAQPKQWAWTDAATADRWIGPFTDSKTALDEARQDATDRGAPVGSEICTGIAVRLRWKAGS